MHFNKNFIWLAVFSPFSFAAYDATDMVSLNADMAYKYDSNVFRLSDFGSNSVVRKNDGQLGDSNLQAVLGAKFQMPISRQKIYANAQMSRQQYFTFEELNYTGWQADVGWGWQLGNQFFGTLAAHSKSSMNSFDDVRNGVVDMVRETGADWNGAWQIHSQWSLLANASYVKQVHDERKLEDAKNSSYGFGLRYVTGKGSSLTLRHNWQDYDYLNDLLFISASLRGYTEQITTLNLVWPITEKIEIAANGGFSQWKSKIQNSKSSRTPQGDLALKWRGTEKTRFRTGYGQNFDQFNSGVGRNLERKAYFGANWEMSEKMVWDAEFSRRQRTTDSSHSIQLRDELYDSFRLRLSYTPVRSVTLSPFVTLERRKDQIGSDDYSDQQYGISGRYDF